jgi:hypothetical protein
MDGRRARVVLGVAIDAEPDEIRRAFRARAQTLHPDHGGDGRAFSELMDAFGAVRSLPSPACARRPRPPRVRVDVYDSVRPAARRDFADVLRAATARIQ